MPELAVLKRSRWTASAIAFVGALLCCMLLVVSTAHAQDAETQQEDEFDDTIHVVQKKPVLQGGRFEFMPRFGISFNDAVYRSYKAGANLNFHFSESFYLGGLFEWYDFGGTLGGKTDTFDTTVDQTSTAPDTAYLNWAGGLELGYKPIYGKFALFNAGIIYYDIGLTLGGAYVNSRSVALPSENTGIGVTGSVNTRLFFNDWLALNFEVRDIAFSGELKGAGSSLTHVVTASAGFSFYLPTGFEYSDSAE